jgi:hypothetical protein
MLILDRTYVSPSIGASCIVSAYGIAIAIQIFSPRRTYIPAESKGDELLRRLLIEARLPSTRQKRSLRVRRSQKF